ncbi:hypothetical protein E2C01_030028 [Portunus trituberculatus]|uniref:Uncharacterized protein n=1 Tax=Portunus trituberculatus TaxID=210409 RepID=A0A5B7ET44_PORTR|nr:hypothetical protein [Portunus trituberculatus]
MLPWGTGESGQRKDSPEAGGIWEGKLMSLRKRVEQRVKQRVSGSCLRGAEWSLVTGRLNSASCCATQTLDRW